VFSFANSLATKDLKQCVGVEGGRFIEERHFNISNNQ
jgi:hypothetical protein